MEGISKITKLVQDMTEYFLTQGYTERAFKFHTSIWKKLVRYCENKNLDLLTDEIIKEFVVYEYQIFSNEKMTSHKVSILRCLRYLKNMQDTGGVCRNPKRKIYVWPENLESYFIECVQAYCVGRKTRTVISIKYYLNKFAWFLAENGIIILTQIEPKYISEFVLSLSSYKASSISHAMCAIRFLFKFSVSVGYMDKDLSSFVPLIRHISNTHIPTIYTKTEIQNMLNAVDRNTNFGKRDYTILLLASRLGMRAGDIRSLQLENLHWDKRIIYFKQQKTNTFLTLPMLDEVGEALADYLMNGRSKTDSRYVFITHIVPFSSFSENACLYCIMDKYLRKAGLLENGRKRGLHSLRHSLASELLRENTGLPIISEVLGHCNTDITKAYLKIDLKQLKKCSLEVPICG